MSIVVVGKCAWATLSEKHWLRKQTQHAVEVRDVYCGCNECWKKKMNEEAEKKNATDSPKRKDINTPSAVISISPQSKTERKKDGTKAG